MLKRQNSNIGCSAARLMPSWLSLSLAMASALSAHSPAIAQQSASRPIVLHAARLLESDTGRMITPGAIPVDGARIAAAASAASHPAGAQVIDLGDTTLLPGLIDAHVHLFLHPGAEDLQTAEESVPQRTVLAILADRAEWMAGLHRQRGRGKRAPGTSDE